MTSVAYDTRFDPPAPVIPLLLRLPGDGDWVRLAGVVDTGADMTLVPADVAERHLPVAGALAIRGATGDVAEAAVYRAEVDAGGIRRIVVVAGFGLETIVGRDLLNRLVLRLDGPARRLEVL